EQIDKVLFFVVITDYAESAQRLAELVSGTARGGEGVEELNFIGALVTSAGYGPDRTEDDFFALFIGDVEGQFGLIERACIILEAAHDGGVDLDAV
ncbi:hypothetical protein ACC740_36780, partial [Rhizobium ruizarguesonis]